MIMFFKSVFVIQKNTFVAIAIIQQNVRGLTRNIYIIYSHKEYIILCSLGCHLVFEMTEDMLSMRIDPLLKVRSVH